MVYDSTWTSDTITPHKNMVSNITIDDLANAEELAELGISEINNVSFKIRAIDREWNEVADASYVKIDIENGDSVAMESQDAIVKEIQKSESEVASSTVSEVKAETPEDSSAASEIDSAGIRPEIKEAIDSYETFMNDYCDFMKKYNESDDTTSMITEYADYMKKYADFTEKFDKIADEDLNAEETEYYTDTLTRVTKKLFETSDNADE